MNRTGFLYALCSPALTVFWGDLVEVEGEAQEVAGVELVVLDAGL